MKPPAPSQPKRPAQKRVPGVEVGDHVYVKHPRRGPIAVKVLSHGRDGLQGKCDQNGTHKVLWSDVLGHKARMLHRYTVVDQGADGAILADSKGKRRFIEGEVPVAEPEPEPKAAVPAAERLDDPILGGLGKMKKSIMTDLPANASIIFMKAAVANRPGLALKDVTDKGGHRTKRWVRTTKDLPKERPAASAKEPGAGAPTMQHGDQVKFRHGDVEGQGKIIASGADGVTLQGHDGREHNVRHEHLSGPAEGGPTAEGEGAKPGAEEAKAPAPEQSAEDPSPLFTPEETKSLPPIASQPVKDRADLFAKSGEALDQLRDWLNRGKGICSELGYETAKGGIGDADLTKPGGLLFIAPLKGEKRAAEKVESDYGGDWSKLLDTVRCSIAVDNFDQVGATLDALKKGGMKLARQPKDRFHKALPVGYRDLLLSVELPNGIIGEVQVHVKPMLQAKSEGHKHYETERSLQSKKGGTLSNEEKAQLEESIKAQTEIYNTAWQASIGGARQGGEMRKAMAEAGEFSFFEHDNAYFRRRNQSPFRSVDDVLVGKDWKPYEGEDSLAPALYGDEVQDPSGSDAGGGDRPGNNDPEGEEKFGKAAVPRVFFMKATIPGGAVGDLLAVPVHVDGHMRDGKYIAPFSSTRHKLVPPADPAPVRAAFEPSPDMRHFYVSAIDGKRRHLVAGPYDTHDKALAQVEAVRAHAASDPRSHFMAWGTAGTAEPGRTPLGADWAPQKAA